jgi:hypothetical protein
LVPGSSPCGPTNEINDLGRDSQVILLSVQLVCSAYHHSTPLDMRPSLEL